MMLSIWTAPILYIIYRLYIFYNNLLYRLT